MFGFDTFKLDGNFFSCSNIRTWAKRKLHSLPDNPKLTTERTSAIIYPLHLSEAGTVLGMESSTLEHG